MDDLNEQEKQEQSVSFEKKYGKRKNFRFLKRVADRIIYRKDILQPMQQEFKTIYKDKILMQDAAERAELRRIKKKEEELNKAYLKSGKTLTLEQRILKDLQTEHPKMVNDEDIIKCSTI